MAVVEYVPSAHSFPDNPPQIINKRRDRRAARQGITLVDMVVTMLILSIVSAVTVPRMTESFQRHRLQSAASVLSGHLNYLKRQAIIRGQTLTVQLSSQPPAIACSQISMPNQPGRPYALDLATEFQIGELSWDGADGTEIRFDRHGDTRDSLTNIDNWSITLVSSNSSAHLAISPNAIDVTVVSP